MKCPSRDAFIEIKSRNIEFVTEQVRLNLGMVAKLQTDTAPEATKSHRAYDMAIYAIAEAEVSNLRSGGKGGSKQGGEYGNLRLLAHPSYAAKHVQRFGLTSSTRIVRTPRSIFSGRRYRRAAIPCPEKASKRCRST